MVSERDRAAALEAQSIRYRGGWDWDRTMTFGRNLLDEAINDHLEYLGYIVVEEVEILGQHWSERVVTKKNKEFLRKKTPTDDPTGE